jgi:hypothetical protein
MRVSLVFGLVALGCTPFSTDGARKVEVDATAPVVDAGIDHAEAGAGAPCLFTFCDSFERTSILGSWTNSIIVRGNLDLDSTTAFKGATSLHARLEPSTGDDVRARLAKRIEGTASAVRITGAIRVELAPLRMAQLVVLDFQNGSVYLVAQDASLHLGEYQPGSSDRSSPIGTIAPGWQSFSLIVTLGTTPVVLTTLGSLSLEVRPTVPLGVMPIDVLVGVPYSFGGGPSDVWIDDLAVDITP